MNLTRTLGLLSLALASPSFAENPAGENAVPFRERGSILGIDLKAIQAALPAFESTGLSIDDYKIIVIEHEDLVVVIFDDPERPSGQRGSTAKMATFEVRLKQSDLSIVGSNFSR